MSHTEQSSIEHRRLLRLAREYRQQGYSVTLYPSPDSLPQSLADYSVDLVAVNGSQSIVAEVRTKESLTLNGSDDLRQIAARVNELPGWELELVITNARKKAS